MGLERLDREDILIRLKQESYFRAVNLTGCDIDPDDVIISHEANGANVIMPIRSRHPIWDEEDNFEGYRYEDWVWINYLPQFPPRFRLIMRRPVHQATFVVFPDWMTIDGAKVAPEVLEAIITGLWEIAVQKDRESFVADLRKKMLNGKGH